MVSERKVIKVLCFVVISEGKTTEDLQFTQIYQHKVTKRLHFECIHQCTSEVSRRAMNSKCNVIKSVVLCEL